MRGLTGDVFCGVWPSDQLSHLRQSFTPPAHFIVNTHPSSKPGEHWLAITIEDDNTATFFDSFGFPPDFAHYPRCILNFLEKRSNKILYHQTQLQDVLSTTCGQHCVFYLCHRACGLSFEKVLSLYDVDDVTKNDEMVSNFVKKYQRCMKNRKSDCFYHTVCSFGMFKDCHRF